MLSLQYVTQKKYILFHRWETISGALWETVSLILLNETNYPESINSIDKIVDVSLAAKKKDLASPLMKNIYLIGFYLCGIFIIDLRVRISRLIKRKTEQGSSFLMTKENRKYIDFLTD